MKYIFKPLEARFRKSNWRSLGFSFNIKFFDGCNASNGLQIVIFISIYYDFTIWIKPFGEIIYR